jgi:hypothetical protein
LDFLQSLKAEEQDCFWYDFGNDWHAWLTNTITNGEYTLKHPDSMQLAARLTARVSL